MTTTRSTVAAFAADPSSSAQARRFVRNSLATMGLGGQVVDTAVLVASELVTNAVLHAHAGPVITVHVEADVVRLEVEDNSELFPLLRNYGDDAVTGRGLDVVEAAANRWGVETTQNGKTVWAEFECNGSTNGSSKPDQSTLAHEFEIPLTQDGQHPVQFLRVPIDLYTEMEQHHEALLREFELMAIAAQQQSESSIAPHLIELAKSVRPLLSEQTHLIRQQVVAAREKGQARCDITGMCDAEGVVWAVSFRELVRETDELCRQGKLLTAAPSQNVVALRRWILDEIIRQYVDRLAPRPAPDFPST